MSSAFSTMASKCASCRLPIVSHTSSGELARQNRSGCTIEVAYARVDLT